MQTSLQGPGSFLPVLQLTAIGLPAPVSQAVWPQNRLVGRF